MVDSNSHRIYLGAAVCCDWIKTYGWNPVKRQNNTKCWREESGVFYVNVWPQHNFFRLHFLWNRSSEWGFFSSTSHPWNSLPSPVFPASFNLLSFKRQVCHHFRDQMAWFCFYYHFLKFYKFVLFFSLLFFPFLKGCRLQKGHIVPVLCSHSLKRKRKSRKWIFWWEAVLRSFLLSNSQIPYWRPKIPPTL